MNAIVAEVARRGRVSFAEFMDLALYHPTAGYYTRRRSGPGPAGRAGDFLTAPTTSPIFSQTLAELLVQFQSAFGEALTFVELGSGEGFLLEGLLAHLSGRRDEVLRRVVSVEQAEWARRRIAKRCKGVEVEASLAAARWPDGPVVLFASEYYDALAVNRITARAGPGGLALLEYYVEPDGRGGLQWTFGEPTAPAILAYLAEHGIAVADGQVVEIRPQARSVHAGHLRWCGVDAVALVLDYGHAGRRLYDPRARRGGSLVGYRTHALVADVLADPGQVDITAHVNFDDLENAAADAGWERGVIRPLGSFLAVHGALSFLPEAVAGGDPLTPAEWAQLAAAKRLLLASGMGADLKVLAQGRGRAWQAYTQLATPPPAEA